MWRKLLVAVLLTFFYILIVGIINIALPNSDIRFILIGLSGMTFLYVSKKINKKLFPAKA